MSQNKPAENKMGTMPVNRLLLSMSIPIMISMLVQALYNVVDSIFVAQLSEDALNAVSLAFPIQNLMISVAVGTGVGINALLSKSLGEKRQDRANAAAMNGLFLAAASSTAARLAGPGKAGRAVAVVFGGFTLAMAIGVPLSTWLGGVVSWRPVLGAIAAFGAFGFLGLLFGM